MAAVGLAAILLGSDCDVNWCSGSCCRCNCNSCSNCSNCSNCNGNNCCSSCCCNNATIGPETGITDPAAYEIHAFEMRASADPRMHPIRALESIDGLSLPMLLGVGKVSTPALRLFTERVIAANPNLLELPAEAGRLLFNDVRADGDDFVVTYRQVVPGFSGIDRVLTYSALLFRLDGAGNLRRIDNRMIVAP